MIDPKLCPTDRISPGKSKVGLPKSWSRADLAAFLSSSDDDAICTLSSFVTHEEQMRETSRNLALAKLSVVERKFQTPRRTS